MIDRLKTPADLANVLGDVSERQVLDWRRQFDWPCVRVGRTIRFTDEQVAQIIARHTQQPAPRVEQLPAVAIGGQTTRSATRSRARARSA